MFFESLLPDFEEQNVHHFSVQDDRVQHVMKKYGIPQDSSELLIRLGGSVIEDIDCMQKVQG